MQIIEGIGTKVTTVDVTAKREVVTIDYRDEIITEDRL